MQYLKIFKVSKKRDISTEDKIDKDTFVLNTTLHLITGRSEVNLPLKSPEEYLNLADSFTQARKRFCFLNVFKKM